MDPVAEVAELEQRLRRAFEERDMDVVEALHAPEFTLNGPAGKIQTRAETMEFLRASQGRQTEAERVVETAYASGDDLVVIMGRESLVWQDTGRPELDGRRTARRFTNVWRRDGDRWLYVARQATTVPVG
jgi:hypothetical protein